MRKFDWEKARDDLKSAFLDAYMTRNWLTDMPTWRSQEGIRNSSFSCLSWATCHWINLTFPITLLSPLPRNREKNNNKKYENVYLRKQTKRLDYSKAGVFLSIQEFLKNAVAFDRHVMYLMIKCKVLCNEIEDKTCVIKC